MYTFKSEQKKHQEFQAKVSSRRNSLCHYKMYSMVAPKNRRVQTRILYHCNIVVMSDRVDFQGTIKYSSTLVVVIVHSFTVISCPEIV